MKMKHKKIKQIVTQNFKNKNSVYSFFSYFKKIQQFTPFLPPSFYPALRPPPPLKIIFFSSISSNRLIYKRQQN